MPKISPTGWLRVIARGLILIVILLCGVLATALLRLVEAPVFKEKRPITPYVTQWVCRAAFLVLGIRHQTRGERMNRPGAIVANHASWLDIFALNARKRIYFVSKAEVASWPGIGLLAKITGTVFIARDPRQAKTQTVLFEKRLLAGHKLLFFPEGTSTDGLRVLPFKTTLFQSFFGLDLRHKMHIQPVTVVYQAPQDQDERFYGWWGDMEFGPHLLHVMAARWQGSVTVIYHPPVKVDEFSDRKALAAHLETIVRGGMPAGRQISG
ncbi:1-acyl-sn-glycerol-3-phosphate acyltransferase [uncultured Roseovarius sp.]|uniref:lysophospholipid acyltransferase family protein n=1 Tax=uncultured Roseovarius sp. TaxID=293344 RepID=UPI002615757B|nr:lysophospholipid acyltransferase family protein [uncultured Roseovarius sp.]